MTTQLNVAGTVIANTAAVFMLVAETTNIVVGLQSLETRGVVTQGTCVVLTLRPVLSVAGPVRSIPLTAQAALKAMKRIMNVRAV